MGHAKITLLDAPGIIHRIMIKGSERLTIFREAKHRENFREHYREDHRGVWAAFHFGCVSGLDRPPESFLEVWRSSEGVERLAASVVP
jgi:hypothetical protein